MPVFLCSALHLPEWRPIVDSVLDPNPKYAWVSSEMFDPSFSFVNSVKSVKSVKSSVFGWRYLDCFSSKFRAKTTVWKLIFRTTLFKTSYFPQRFRYGPNIGTYKQHILFFAYLTCTLRKSRWIVVTEKAGDVLSYPPSFHLEANPFIIL